MSTEFSPCYTYPPSFWCRISHLPFSGSDPTRLNRSIACDSVQPIKDRSAPVIGLIGDILAKDPLQRPTAEEVRWQHKHRHRIA